MHLRDCGTDAGVDETVVGHFLGESPYRSQPEIDRGWGQFLFDEHRLVSMNQGLTQLRRLLPTRPRQEFIESSLVGAACMGARKAIERQADQALLRIGHY